MSVSLDELTSLRADLAGIGMPDLCDVQRASYGAADPYGGQGEPSWATSSANVRCAYWQAGGRTRVGETQTVIETQRVVLPHGTDVHEGDRIVNVRAPGGALRTAGPLRIDSVARREAVVECDVTELSWDGS